MSCRTALLALAGPLLLLSAVPADERPADKKAKPTNRLARETSPYLLQHAHNPVDWYPWGADAFAKAKKENKLVFLSIGYSSCHWCHVMERESFANDEVAKYLNAHFVCIKVDREERPDIDHVYMTALNTMGSRGGWPLSMFLMSDGRPIVGGTYWPREDREIDAPGGKEKVRGFKTILGIVQKFHAEKPKDLDEQADRLAKGTVNALAGAVRGLALIELNRDLVTAATDGLKEEFDKEYGGFGSPRRNFDGPKFPTPPALRLLQTEAARTKSKDLDTMVTVTLDRMARGGIYDHLGGGFHRYSTERTWTVPHFEKMLYDNAQLCEVYADAYRRTKSLLYKRVLEGTMAFVARELTAPEGGFYSALDADSEGEEGKFYVWTGKEIDAVLTDKEDAALFKKVYGADGKPNFEEKYHILVLAKPLAETAKGLKLTEGQLEARLAPLRQKLLAARSKRVRPFLDTKILTAWNGQMIAGAARAGGALGDKAHTDRAVRAAEFVLKTLRTRDGRLLRTYGAAPGRKAEARLNGYLDDYAFLVHGLLTLHDVTKDKRWLDEAKALTATMVKYHLDEEQGGFYYTSNDHEKLFARAKDQHDGAQPSGNSVAAQNLVRLWAKTGDERYARLADKTIKALAAPLKMNPTGLTAMAEALAMYLDAKKK
ncbi:MAG TPA: thioredoxin domain-containing protein [Gemmataceae bacterium]|nr:thioredoxin domain-containing protein [Gemmataceae bacterium]